MAKEEVIKVSGVVVDLKPGTTFIVKIDEMEQQLLCHLNGKMRQYRIKVLLGDKVDLEISPYDMTKGRITHRHK